MIITHLFASNVGNIFRRMEIVDCVLVTLQLHFIQLYFVENQVLCVWETGGIYGNGHFGRSYYFFVRLHRSSRDSRFLSFTFSKGTNFENHTSLLDGDRTCHILVSRILSCDHIISTTWGHNIYTLMIMSHTAQLGTLCCNWVLRNYQEVESSNLVTDY